MDNFPFSKVGYVIVPWRVDGYSPHMLWFFGPFIKLHVGVFATYFDRKVNDSREKRETCTNFPSPPLPKSKIIVVFGEVNKTRHEKTTLVFKHIHSPQIGETWTNPHPLESKKTDWIITIEVFVKLFTTLDLAKLFANLCRKGYPFYYSSHSAKGPWNKS